MRLFRSIKQFGGGFCVRHNIGMSSFFRKYEHSGSSKSNMKKIQQHGTAEMFDTQRIYNFSATN